MPIKVISDPCKTFHLVSAATTNPSVVKPGQTLLVGWYITNTAAAISYLVFHDQPTLPTAGSNVHSKFGIPATGAANAFPGSVAIPFVNGLAITTVTGAADGNTTAVASGEQVINLYYR